ncbi:hypothetical protein [Desulfosporosinus sp. FKB]|nr:hypothetical protein [Desulfosporosinus sp. FKB]
MAISARVQEALIKLEEHDINDALIQLSIAVLIFAVRWDINDKG